MINPVTNEPFTNEDADRLLGLADQFLEDWGELVRDGSDNGVDFRERRREFDAIRPLLVAAPELLELVKAFVLHVQQGGAVSDEVEAAERLLNSLGNG